MESFDLFLTVSGLFMKSVVSWTYNGKASACGYRLCSKNLEILLLWHSIELTTGLPGMYFVHLL